MYAIVRAGGRQEKVEVGDVLVVVDRMAGEPGASVQLPAVLLVDGASVTTDKAALGKVKVTSRLMVSAFSTSVNEASRSPRVSARGASPSEVASIGAVLRARLSSRESRTSAGSTSARAAISATVGERPNS